MITDKQKQPELVGRAERTRPGQDRKQRGGVLQVESVLGTKPGRVW